MSIKDKLYKLAIWYIGKYNANSYSPNIKKDLDKLDRLTYRFLDKCYLRYGCDNEWQHFSRYDVIDNAIKKLCEYEDNDNINVVKDDYYELSTHINELDEIIRGKLDEFR